MSSEERNGLNSNKLPFTPRALPSIDWIHTQSNKYAGLKEPNNTTRIVIMPDASN